MGYTGSSRSTALGLPQRVEGDPVIQTFLHPITAHKTKILGRDIRLDMIHHLFGGIAPGTSCTERRRSPPSSSRHCDIEYASLAKNMLPVPVTEQAPDMTKHKAK